MSQLQTVLLVHAGPSAPKWGMGTALCGRTIGVKTPRSSDAAAVTCTTCKARLEAGWTEWHSSDEATTLAVPAHTIACPTCGSTDAEHLFGATGTQSNGLEAGVDVYQCRACGADYSD